MGFTKVRSENVGAAKKLTKYKWITVEYLELLNKRKTCKNLDTEKH